MGDLRPLAGLCPPLAAASTLSFWNSINSRFTPRAARGLIL
jgi:hypothetical protein